MRQIKVYRFSFWYSNDGQGAEFDVAALPNRFERNLFIIRTRLVGLISLFIERWSHAIEYRQPHAHRELELFCSRDQKGDANAVIERACPRQAPGFGRGKRTQDDHLGWPVIILEPRHRRMGAVKLCEGLIHHEFNESILNPGVVEHPSPDSIAIGPGRPILVAAKVRDTINFSS